MTIALRAAVRRAVIASSLLGAVSALPAYADGFSFTGGDLVISIEGNGSNTGTYTDNQAAPITLQEFSLSGTSSATQVGSLELPTSISGEYGSSSEGSLQLSGNGQYLTIMGYGINADTFNANPSAYGPSGNTALAQTYSSAVSRVVALISANGSVDTSTQLTNVFSGNNPRSAYTYDGSSFYVSGQGTSGDTTGGVFYATRGATTATAITGADAGSGAYQDTRSVTVYNNTLYVSVDSKSGSTNRDYIGTLGTAGTLPTTLANSGSGPTQLTGFGSSATGKLTLTAANANTVNASLVGTTSNQVNLSPENYFFANSTTLYVADSGDPKNTSGKSTLGDGGLQKWVYSAGTWNLEYTLSQGLDLVANSTGSGTSGLLGLTGEVVGNSVELFATSYSLTDTGPTYLYGITDALSATSGSSETFSLLDTAAADTTIKGVSFAPTSAVPLPAGLPLLLGGLGMVLVIGRSRRARGTGLATA